MTSNAWCAAALGILLAGCATDDAASTPDAQDDTAAPIEETTSSEDAPSTPETAEDAAPEVEAPPPGPHIAPIGAEDLTFATGPYVMHTTRTTISLAWETEAAGDTRVEYGADATYGMEATGPEGTLHRVELTDLEPATLYHYRACTADVCTADLSFVTAPVAGQPFRFAVYGDSRSDPPQHRAVVDTIIESMPSLVLHTGDIVEHGAERDQYRTMHFDPTRQLGHHIPIYVAIGNHEWKDLASDVQNFRDYLVYPKEADAPHPGLNYTVSYGDAFFIVMDNTLDGLDLFFPLGDSYIPPLWEWLNAVASSEAAQAATWRFAFFHYPPGSPCHEDWPMIVATRDHVIPLLRDNGFQAMFTGHVHDYERHDYDGFPVIITGGGGAGLEPEEICTRPSESLQLLRSVHHHVTVDIHPESALVQAVDITGEAFDVLTLKP